MERLERLELHQLRLRDEVAQRPQAVDERQNAPLLGRHLLGRHGHRLRAEHHRGGGERFPIADDLIDSPHALHQEPLGIQADVHRELGNGA